MVDQLTLAGDGKEAREKLVKRLNKYTIFTILTATIDSFIDIVHNKERKTLLY